MLKRIKIRGKLLLLLATPVLAVIVFAATGVQDRLDNTTFQDREATIAELADAGSDLSLSVQIQRMRGLAADADAEIDVEGAETATNAAIDRWLMAAADARDSINDPDLVDDLDDLATSLGSLRADSADMKPEILSASLALASRRVGLVTPQLVDEPADLNLFRALADHLRVAQIQNAIGEVTALGAAAIEQGDVPTVSATLLDAADSQLRVGVDQFLGTADDEYVSMVEDMQSERLLPTRTSGSSIAELDSTIDSRSRSALTDWLAAGEDRLTRVNAVSDALLEDALAQADAAAALSREQANSFMLLAGSVALLALALAVIVGRSISRPLTRLTHNAEQLSTEELPALVESLRSGGRSELPEISPIEVKGRDEIAKLARAFSEIQQVTVDVAEEQGELLRRGISDIFVNLARRNQSLLDRQIDFIDQLEAREESPEQLENLFRLDHLATRMRRNAESLLVLAGAEPARRRGRPVEIGDVARVAMGEIEDYGRIRPQGMDSATISGAVAVDLAHVLSELMENATQFSPPDSGVDIVGTRAADGSYVLTITDHGIGMSDDALTTANTALSEPPLIGLDLSRSLGFTVVSRLAHRLGVTVTLADASEGGVAASIAVPAAMVGDAAPEEPTDFPETMAPPVGEPTDMAPSDIASAGIAHTDSAHIDSALTPAPPADPGFAEAPTEAFPAMPALSDYSPPPDAPAPFMPVADDTEPPGFGEAPAADEPAPLPRRTRGADASESAAVDNRPTADMFDVLSAPPVPPAPPDPDTDIFAPIDTPAPSLPRRQPASASDETPRDGVVPTAPPADIWPPTAAVTTPFPPVEATDDPVAAPSGEPAPLPTRRAAEVGAVDASVTQAGLIRRTPRQVEVPDESKYSAPVPATSASPSRSPEEVREMLSRYRSGRRRGREPGTTDEQPNNQG